MAGQWGGTFPAQRGLQPTRSSNSSSASAGSADSPPRRTAAPAALPPRQRSAAGWSPGTSARRWRRRPRRWRWRPGRPPGQRSAARSAHPWPQGPPSGPAVEERGDEREGGQRRGLAAAARRRRQRAAQHGTAAAGWGRRASTRVAAGRQASRQVGGQAGGQGTAALTSIVACSVAALALAASRAELQRARFWATALRQRDGWVGGGPAGVSSGRTVAQAQAQASLGAAGAGPSGGFQPSEERPRPTHHAAARLACSPSSWCSPPGRCRTSCCAPPPPAAGR